LLHLIILVTHTGLQATAEAPLKEDKASVLLSVRKTYMGGIY
jgi:hypothetical protein